MLHFYLKKQSEIRNGATKYQKQWNEQKQNIKSKVNNWHDIVHDMV